MKEKKKLFLIVLAYPKKIILVKNEDSSSLRMNR